MTTRKWLSLVLTSLATGVLLFGNGGVSTAGDGVTAGVARSQLRRSVDPSPRSALGSVLIMVDKHGKETFQINITKLGQQNYGPVFRDEPSYTTNVTTVLELAPLARTSVSRGTWSRTLIGTNEAPADFLPLFGDLAELSNTEIDVAQPGTPLVTTITTNITAGVTNISVGVTNVVGNVTNIINGIEIPNPGQTGSFFSVMWAPLYQLNAKPNLLSYHRHGKLVAVGDASPKAAGTVKISFDGTTGRSQFQVHAVNLTPGQQYTLFIADDTNHVMTVLLPVDNMTQKNFGSTATFVRDTQFGDPLPQQARDIGDLSGRIIQIRDAFDIIHMQGDMP